MMVNGFLSDVTVQR